MRKALGLAAIAAMALMAAAGAGSASADVFCTVNNTPECSHGAEISVIEPTLVKGSSLKLTDTSGNPLHTCSDSTISVNIEKQGEGVEPEGKTSTFDWSGCTNPTTTVKNGSLKVETRETSPGVFVHTVTAFGTEVTTQIPFFGSCVFGVGSGVSLGDLVLGNTAVLHVNTSVSKTSGGFACPSSYKWIADYQIANHSAVWISKKQL
jgi:hypothetical protein